MFLWFGLIFDIYTYMPKHSIGLVHVWNGQFDIVSWSLICDFSWGCWNSSRVEICAQLSESITHQTVNFILDLWSGEGVSEHPMFSVLWQSVLTLGAGKAANISKYQVGPLNLLPFGHVFWHMHAKIVNSQTSTYCNFIARTLCYQIHIYIILYHFNISMSIRYPFNRNCYNLYLYRSNVQIFSLTYERNIHFTCTLNSSFELFAQLVEDQQEFGCIVCIMLASMSLCPLEGCSHCSWLMFESSVAKSTHWVLWNLLKCPEESFHHHFSLIWNSQSLLLFWRCVGKGNQISTKVYKIHFNMQTALPNTKMFVYIYDVCNMDAVRWASQMPTDTSKVWFDPRRACRSFLLWPFVRRETEPGWCTNGI